MNNKIKNGGKEMLASVVTEPKDNSVVVETEHLKKHRLYDKNYKINKKIKASCNNIILSIGDRVLIKETRPISKNIHFKVISKEK